MSPPSLGRVLWGEFPGVGGTTGRSDSSRPSGRPVVSLGSPYLGQMACFALRAGPPEAVPKPGRCFPGNQPGRCTKRREASHVPGEPGCAHALFSDPGRPSRPATDGVSVLPSATLTAWATANSRFRGSIARPMRSLSTLHGGGRPSTRKTRFRLAASLDRTGLGTRRVPMKSFGLHDRPPFPS